MHRNSWLTALLLGMVPATVIACVGGQPQNSTITGSIAQETFPAAVERIIVVTDNGARREVALQADASFRVKLRRGASYTLLASVGGREVPLVLREVEGNPEAAVRVISGGATAHLGTIRYWPGAESAAPTARRAELRRVSLRQPITESSEGACVNGAHGITGRPCAEGAAAAICSVDDDADSDADSDNDSDGHSCDGRWRGDDGRSEHNFRGDDRANPTVVTVAATDAMAVTQLSLTPTLGCAKDDDSDSDSDD